MKGKTMYKISIVVPIYNGEMFVKQCSEMLCGQTLKDIQVVMVDDGSKDNSWELIQESSRVHKNITAIHQENKGVSVARNTGLSLCEGDYIGFMDVDDKIDQDMFEVLYNIAEEKKLDICGFEKIGKSGEVSLFDDRREVLKLLFTQKLEMGVWTKIIKASILKGLLFPVGLRINEDMLFNYYVYTRTDKIGFVNLEKYHYILRDGSSSRPTIFTDKFFDIITVAERMYADCLDKFPEIADYAEIRRARSYMRATKQFYMRGTPEEYLPRIQELKKYLVALDKRKLRIYFGKYDVIRYVLYIYLYPVFVLFEKYFDK